jgi:hypothetical protein
MLAKYTRFFVITLECVLILFSLYAVDPIYVKLPSPLNTRSHPVNSEEIFSSVCRKFSCTLLFFQLLLISFFFFQFSVPLVLF